ncbi:Na+/H+ antiporter NhaC family protein [Alkaliphilus serpentinus]|uniref:Sodium:proton antiporter n=1 Tax=Alkaliphilus serpentinus TaxID=1482731 RepID=A0A833HQD2_9FIRM|nr:Na+/H+ antiporter NhaC family protein [Alkaliphilus serpentinus]KAB3531783.1 sodium:proton antiporter [Alkaliphilus serpentinus]
MDQEISILQRYLVFAATMLFISLSIAFNISIFIGFLLSIAFTSWVLWKKGFKVRPLLLAIFNGLKECQSLYIFILLIGGTVSLWLSSGVVPAMIYYGLQYMQGFNFLLAAFIITSIAALFMGTAVGTLSTIGIALLGVGRGFGLPPHILLGTIVSGGFLADKLSPISGLMNLTLASTNTKYREALSSMTKTLIPVYVFTAFIYFMIGSKYDTATTIGTVETYQSALQQGFNLSPWLLILPVITIILSVIGLKPLYTICLGMVGGMIVSKIVQALPYRLIFSSMMIGYRGDTPSQELNRILFSGGIASMVEVVFIVAGAIALSTLFEASGLIKPLINRVVACIKSEGELIRKTGLISCFLTIITCDQTVGIVLPGRMFKEKFKELGVNSQVLARTISDTGTIIAPLFPWNVNALIIGMITGISALSYGPYAVLCYIFPIFTVAYSFFIKKIFHIHCSKNKHVYNR